jgi:uncharacterized protein YegP (UPF0339 family)
MYFEILRSSNGQYWFRIVASNGRILAHSEEYTSRQGAQNAIDTIKQNARNAAVR